MRHRPDRRTGVAFTRLLLGVAVLGASAGADAAGPAADQELDTDTPQAEPLDAAAILSGELTAEDYAEDQLCVHPRDLDSIEVLNDRLVLFHGRRGEVWLNQLASQCLGLEPDMVLDLRSYGGSFCRLDRFRGTPRFDATLHLTAECRLGAFETIAEPHAEALRTAAAEQRQAADAAAKTKRAQRRSRRTAKDR